MYGDGDGVAGALLRISLGRVLRSPFGRSHELEKILQELLEDGDHKIIIFSEWQRMLELVRELATRKSLGYAWHTGQVSQQKRRDEIRRFKNDPECRLFLSTDSGSVGLNLQVADVVINLDMPWNPAKLEQRIARAWRKHQKRPVQVINLVSEHSIEHRMLSLLEQKRSLAEGVVDGKGKSEMSLPSGRAAFLERLDALMAGATIERAARLAGRVSGDSTVAYALGFAQALEAALGVEVPPRAAWLRALAAELERLANHFGDIGAVCNDAAFAIMHAQCGLLREQVLRAAHACFGHRLMMDYVVPGGTRCDLPDDGEGRLLALLADVRRRFPELVELYEDTASLKDRTVGTGILSRELARQFAAGGYVGRASGRSFDARRTPGYAPYDQLQFEVPVVEAGDVNARLWIRIREVEQSLGLIEQILRRLPSGELCVSLYTEEAGEGLALVEGFRGDILAWVRTRPDGKIDRCHLRDPSWFQWPLLEAAIEGNIVADFPLCNKSFNCSYSGHDL